MTKNRIVGLLFFLAAIVALLGGDVSIFTPTDPAPFVTDGDSVLIIEDDTPQGRSKLTTDQDDAIRGTGAGSLQDYVSTHSDRKLVTIDQGQDVSKMPPWVQEAAKVKRDKLPWIVMANSKTGYSKVLVDTAESIKLFEAMQSKVK